VAARWSDYLVLTSDNPRNENPLDIIAEIEEGVRRAFPGSSNYVKIEDRRKAIQEAIGAAREGDLVIIAGKGHETYQILKDKTIPFDDREVARSILREIEERRKG
jgi:UDP-N-acetylmuramoyl-L-alanyl-D-glutamate--2,6-diaminopimelate ligase